MLLAVATAAVAITEARGALEMNALANLTRKGLAVFAAGKYRITDRGRRAAEAVRS